MEVLKAACECGNVELAQITINENNIDRRIICQDSVIVLRWACRFNQFEFAEWLTDTYLIRKDDILDWVFLDDICQFGNLAAIQWIFAHFKFTNDEVCANDSRIMLMVCGSGHLHIAQWLVDKYQITAFDIRNVDGFGSNILCSTMINNYLPTAKWLVKTFGLVVDDLRANNNEIINFVIAASNIKVIKWMFRHFELTEEDLYAYNKNTYKHMMMFANTEVIEWVVAKFLKLNYV